MSTRGGKRTAPFSSSHEFCAGPLAGEHQTATDDCSLHRQRESPGTTLSKWSSDSGVQGKGASHRDVAVALREIQWSRSDALSARLTRAGAYGTVTSYRRRVQPIGYAAGPTAGYKSSAPLGGNRRGRLFSPRGPLEASRDLPPRHGIKPCTHRHDATDLDCGRRSQPMRADFEDPYAGRYQ